MAGTPSTLYSESDIRIGEPGHNFCESAFLHQGHCRIRIEPFTFWLAPLGPVIKLLLDPE
jgi:hypothetical protein